MNTKASSILMMIFEVLVVLLVIFLTVSVAQAYGKSDTTFKINTAEDLRMIMDTLVAVPGDAVVQYPYDVGKFSFILSTGSIAVFTKGELENKWIIRKFNLPDGFVGEGVVEGQSTICLEKKSKKILLRACATGEFS